MESVRSQSFRNVEHVIVDGASSDSTCAIIQQELQRPDHRIGWWCSEEDSGIYNAWNKAILHCRGEWVLFLGADDTLADDMVLETFAQTIEKVQETDSRTAWFALGKVRALYPDGSLRSVMGGDWKSCGKPFIKSGIFGPLIPHQGVFHHISCFDALGGFDDSFRIAGDSDYIVRMLKDRPWYYYIDEIVADFKVGGVSGQEQAAIAACRENIRIYRSAHFPSSLLHRSKIIAWNILKIMTFSRGFRFAGRPLANLRLKLKGRRSHWGVGASKQNIAFPGTNTSSNNVSPKKQAAVLIPLYQPVPSANEEKALLNLLNRLSEDVILCCPESMDAGHIQNLAILQGRELLVQRFADEHFSSVRSYNLLMLSEDFYQRFEPYEFVLIHQLDGWVFGDHLREWCDKDYDYIGAPWFFRFGDATEKSRMLPWAGNGGFSLRRIDAMLRVIQKIQRPPNMRERFLLLWLCERRLKFRLLRKLLLQPLDSALNYYRELDIWEDQVYAILHNDMIQVASPEVSRGFAFEVNPKRLYRENQHKLPFGCHAWEKFEPEFWRTFQESSDTES